MGEAVSGAVVGHRELGGFAATVLARTGYPAGFAELIAGGLVEANLRGQPSHGVLHLANLVRRTRDGLVDPSTSGVILERSAAAARIDGRNGQGIVVARAAMDLAVTMATETGVGAVAVLNSTHYGLGALHSEAAARSGCIGIALSNATPMLAPAGGAQRVIGTNPISIAVPGESDVAMSLDMGLSRVTMGFLREHFQRGAPLPAGVALAADGQPTTDAKAALEGGSLIPAGDSKGFALAIAVEMLTGVLSGGAIAEEVGSLFVDFSRPQRTSHFMLALDPRRFLPPASYRAGLDRLVRWIHGASTADGTASLYVPGERTKAAIAKHRDAGIAIDRTTAADLASLGRSLGVAVPAGLA
ncbi:MAG: Ldh family oxidoreductase [Chloroflexi bacterium]|nr:Ldh family oxidoreductase [Chloroflexota bacterium]